jgi:hypothetical protein
VGEVGKEIIWELHPLKEGVLVVLKHFALLARDQLEREEQEEREELEVVSKHPSVLCVCCVWYVVHIA